MFNVGDRVMRRSGSTARGTIERIRGEQANVLWDHAYSSYGSIHSWLKLTALVPADSAAAIDRREKVRQQIAAQRATYRYCDRCHHRLNDDGTCYQCDTVEAAPPAS